MINMQRHENKSTMKLKSPSLIEEIINWKHTPAQWSRIPILRRGFSMLLFPRIQVNSEW